MTKKLFAIAISVLFVFGLIGPVLAEQGSTSYSGKKYYEQQVFVDVYNNSAGTLLQNAVVILDASTGTTLGDALGSYVTTAATASLPLVFGVVDSNILLTTGTGTMYYGIPASAVGRVCIRGPHKVLVAANATTPTVGIMLGTSATAQYAGTISSATAGTYATYGALGVVLASDSSTAQWVWIQPHVSQ